MSETKLEATNPRHVRELARAYSKARREDGAPALAMVGALPEWDECEPDADLSGELLALGLALASDGGGRLPRPVPGYLETLPDASLASTGCQLHDCGVRRCIAAEWSFAAVVSGAEVLPGRVSLIGRAERARTGTPALWRVAISLPWFVLADAAERARGLAHLFAACGWDGEREAHIRRPDFAGFAHVIQRHGLPDTREHARALAEVASSNALIEMMRRHYPGRAAQGQLFAATQVIEATE